MVSNVLVARPRLPRALGLLSADGSFVTLAESHAATPLTRTVRCGCAPGTSALLLTLVEGPPPPTAVTGVTDVTAVDVSDATAEAAALPPG